MSRNSRILKQELYYHVVSRGVRQEVLFRKQEDYSTFLYIIDQLYKEVPYKIPSFCLMNNHYHLILQTSSLPISNFMYLLNRRYATYFNNKYCFSGHVFEKSYFSSPIYSREGLLTVSKYIHLNPLKAKIVKKPEHYPWSSYSFYKNHTIIPPIYINLNEVLLNYDGSLLEKKKAYTIFVEE